MSLSMRQSSCGDELFSALYGSVLISFEAKRLTVNDFRIRMSKHAGRFTDRCCVLRIICGTAEVYEPVLWNSRPVPLSGSPTVCALRPPYMIGSRFFADKDSVIECQR